MVWKLQGRAGGQYPISKISGAKERGEKLEKATRKQSPRKSAKFPSGQERETNTRGGYRMMTDTEFQRAHWRWKEEWPEWNTQY